MAPLISNVLDGPQAVVPMLTMPCHFPSLTSPSFLCSLLNNLSFLREMLFFVVPSSFLPSHIPPFHQVLHGASIAGPVVVVEPPKVFKGHGLHKKVVHLYAAGAPDHVELRPQATMSTVPPLGGGTASMKEKATTRLMSSLTSAALTTRERVG